MQTTLETKLKRHVTFCPQGDKTVTLSGEGAEHLVVQYLIDNLNIRSVGDFRVLVNYNLPLHGPGATGSLEIDILMINKFGVFLIEVKNWQGTIDAYDDGWWQNSRHKRGNVFVSINNKARILSSRLDNVNVIGLIVLFRGRKDSRGKQLFFNHSNHDDRVVFGKDHALLRILNSSRIFGNKWQREILSDEDIMTIRNELFKEYSVNNEILIEDYRVVRELLPGDLFDAFEALDVHISNRRVRIKLYQLYNISRASEEVKKQFKRSAEAVSKLGIHPNILYTINFFPDPERPDTFYEVTELVDGNRLDAIIEQCQTSLSLDEQLYYLESLCIALEHAHSRQVYHRNLCPETVFVSKDQVIKLADFDYAKLEGMDTISQPDEILVDTIFTAPEILTRPSSASPASDIYSLGVLWYFLASLPEKPTKFIPEKIEAMKLPKPARRLMKKMVSEVVQSRPQRAKNVLDQLKGIESI